MVAPQNLLKKTNKLKNHIHLPAIRSNLSINNEVKFIKTSSVQCANAQFLLVAPPKPRCGGYCHRRSKYCGRVVPMPCKPTASSKGQCRARRAKKLRAELSRDASELLMMVIRGAAGSYSHQRLSNAAAGETQFCVSSSKSSFPRFHFITRATD